VGGCGGLFEGFNDGRYLHIMRPCERVWRPALSPKTVSKKP
jgi:hypothetical protein